MNAQLISIGNELLIGDTINTNASWMGQFLNDLGIQVTRIHTISDDASLIASTVKQSMKESDLVITTGGLGPTHDDITKTTIAELFGANLTQNDDVLTFIKELFESRNIPFSSSNTWQAMVPENCEVLFNKAGTAPGMWFHEDDCYLAVLPGVPHEMRYLMKKGVAQKLRETDASIAHIYTKYIKTAGIGESTLSDYYLGDLSRFLNKDASLAFLPSAGSVTLRVTGKGITKERAIECTSELIKHIYAKAGNVIYGEGKDITLSESVGKSLVQQNLSISTAESCTGGLIASTLTDIPGSSAYMSGGIIAYANEIKINELNVSKEAIVKYGAVSKSVALQMAKGVAMKFNTDIGISTTGVAGPGGGSDDKPVGTVWIGFYSKQQHFALKALFTKDRLMNKQRSTVVALEVVRRVLAGLEELPYGLKKEIAE